MGDAESRAWYAEGLHFSCTQCGNCCRVEGYVWVGRPEVEQLAELLELTVDEFGRRFLRRIGRRLSLIEKANHDCIFWQDGCTVYPARPRQCRTFPFWNEHLANEPSWREVVEECPGSGEGRRYSFEEIERLRCGKGATAPAADNRSQEAKSP